MTRRDLREPRWLSIPLALGAGAYALALLALTAWGALLPRDVRFLTMLLAMLPWLYLPLLLSLPAAVSNLSASI